VLVRHRLRPADLGRDLLVRVEWGVQAVLRRRSSPPFFAALLALFAREAGAGRERMIALLLDNAGWHTAPNLAVPDGIRLVYLPSYSPELQPAEHLWPVLDEPLANRHFATLADLEQVVAQRCRILNGDQLKPGTNFHWWPTPAIPA
jgi:transposase